MNIKLRHTESEWEAIGIIANGHSISRFINIELAKVLKQTPCTNTKGIRVNMFVDIEPDLQDKLECASRQLSISKSAFLSKFVLEPHIYQKK